MAMTDYILGSIAVVLAVYEAWALWNSDDDVKTISEWLRKINRETDSFVMVGLAWLLYHLFIAG